MQHVKRWITALILAPLVIWVLARGNVMVLAALVCVVAIAALREYLTVIFGNKDGPISNTIKVISFVIAITLVMGATLGAWQVMFLILSLNLAALAVFVLFRFAVQPRVFDIISKQVLGIVYIPVPLSLLIFIREREGGALWIIWLLIVIFANDTGAFYTGTYKGRHKLAPNISPNKTVEGAVGGILTAVAAGFVFCLVFFRDPALALLILPCSLVMALAGQAGDLFESAMKRVTSIKDSGRILPGHGGMLDRIDGLLMAVPVLYVYLVFVL